MVLCFIVYLINDLKKKNNYLPLGSLFITVELIWYELIKIWIVWGFKINMNSLSISYTVLVLLKISGISINFVDF